MYIPPCLLPMTDRVGGSIYGVSGAPGIVVAGALQPHRHARRWDRVLRWINVRATAGRVHLAAGD